MADPTAPALSLRKLGRIARKLHLHDNCLLLVRSGCELARQDNIDALSKVVERTQLKNVIVAVVDDLQDLTALDQAEMAKSGWFHVDTLSKIIKLPEKDKEQDNDQSQ